MKKMIVYKSDYQEICFNELNSTLELHWNENSANLDKNLLKQEMISQTEFIKLYNPERCLVDTKKFFFHVSEDVQDWIDRKIAKGLMNPKILKMAFVMNDKSYTGISINRIIDEKIQRNFNGQIFNEEKKAYDWLTT